MPAAVPPHRRLLLLPQRPSPDQAIGQVWLLLHRPVQPVAGVAAATRY
jgi:hypothetical protein